MYILWTKEKFTLKNNLVIFSLALFYFITAKVGLKLAFLHPSATPFWPPTGIAIAAFLILGSKIWLGIFLGAFLVNLTTEGNILTSLGIASGNTLEGYLGAYLVRRYIGTKDTFLKPANLFKYSFLVGTLSTMVSATVGVASLYFGGFLHKGNIALVWTTWWLGDIGGAMVIAPLILLWVNNYKLYLNLSRLIEVIVGFLLVILINIGLYGGLVPSELIKPPLPFLSLPVIVWLAFRFGPREVMTSIFFIFIIVIMGTLNGIGPYVRSNPNESLFYVQLFMGFVFLSVMPLAAASYQQKRIEEFLRERKEKYRNLLETSPDAIFVTDLEGRVEVVNKKTLEIYGFRKRSEIVGKKISKFVTRKYIPIIKNTLGKILNFGKAENIEYMGRKKNGEKIYFLANASILYDLNQNPEGIIFISHDISKKVEIDKLKSEFVSLASHQLRTPLGNMRWTIEMLMNGDYGKVPGYLNNTVEELYGILSRLIHLVNDLLDISRMEDGVFRDNPKDVYIANLLKKVITHLTPLANKNMIKIRFKKTKKANGKIFIDNEKLGDVFENILSNSIKYNKPEGRIFVHLKKAGNFYRIVFKDTGIGISKNDQEKIFTKFFRTEQAEALESEGTGLGLYLAKSYIENWGGKIYLKSKIDRGSSFIIDLPLKPKNSVKKIT